MVASDVHVYKLKEGFRYIFHDVLAKWLVKPNDLTCPFFPSAEAVFVVLLFIVQVCRVTTYPDSNLKKDVAYLGTDYRKVMRGMRKYKKKFMPGQVTEKDSCKEERKKKIRAV